MTVVMLCCVAGTVKADEPGNPRLLEAQTAYDEAVKLFEAGKYADALVRGNHSRLLREAELGGSHPDVAKSVALLGILHWTQGDYVQAEPLIQRGLEIREAALGKNHPDVADSLNNLANLYMNQGLFAQAESLHERAIAIREAALGKDHPSVAGSLNNLANLYRAQGLYGRAEPLFQRSIAIKEGAFGKNHPKVATSLNSLANLYMNLELYARAEPLYARALAIWEEAFGKSHPSVATSLHNLANLYSSQGLHGRAEPLYVRALAILEEVLGKNHPDVALSLRNLALLYTRQGLYGRAEPLYLRALALGEKVLGKDHPRVALSLYDLANLYIDQGLYGRAKPLYLRALAIREKALGKDHREVALSLSGLASLYVEQGLYSQAEPLYARALAIQEKVLGKDHIDVADSLSKLAHFYSEQGLYGRAEPLYLRALAIREMALGSHHPEVAQMLNSLAQLNLAQHRLTSALPLFTRAFAISEQRLRQEALDFSESRLLSFLQHLRADEQALYSLLRAYPEDARVRQLALSAVLLLKGRSVEETADISRTLYRSPAAEDRETFERLRSLRTQLATLSLAGPGSLTPVDYQQRLRSLADEGEALEADLAKHSAPLRALTARPPPSEIVGRVAASLPKDGALVEFIAYEDSPLISKPGTPRAKRPPQLRYLALVLFPDASTRAVDLGLARPIDLAASRLRTALTNRDVSFEAMAREFHRLAFQPLRSLLGTTRRLFLSPDGQLGLVPFSALHDGRSFLLDTFDFIYLTSGRELLPRPQEITPSTSVFVLADPDFTTAPRVASSASAPFLQRSESSGAPERLFSILRADLPSSAWVPLPGTRLEAQSIQRLLPQAQLFLGSEATKERLLQLTAPGILHLATHGFFLEDASPPSADSRAVGHFGALGDNPRAPRPQEPLLRSGIALAGARVQVPAASPTSESRPDAALVTALELAGLDLWGTQLVVLSACDTGRGDVKLGQGVYGLRRSLVVAGAETVVMSLWKVSDDSTRLLMDTYYRNLMAGQGRASALREAMRSFRVSRPHPHDWAPFIALGSDEPLRAITPSAPPAQEP
ncbi:CHAT domain-containing protein [Stigmatella sp. ncwal1]|uniref:CHAT domain-containing protein n=3 Tax=Stigmatella ashevillensis TaxID=2995309 RepID=A0ABT5DG71_9BACT|nr:CHAT domain-containing tetratricopeptide repeat protein [Stigmatella ashevillena]MDC0712579.1 CHAT domain-containing protein [Stigmatella ashevillena]